MREPAYIRLSESGAPAGRAGELAAKLSDCGLCPRSCMVDRTAGELGECRTGEVAEVACHGPHFGEEAPLVGTKGSGTIFFARCNLACRFCQNYDISQVGRGREAGADEIASMMLELQEIGCHNINFVSPTHVAAQIVEAVAIAAKRGLRLPLVYNSGGYDSVDTLRLLEGIVDIYMPDMKYSDDLSAMRYSGVGDYWEVNKSAVAEMHRQVGDLETDDRGVARRGLLVRHLVLPEGRAGSREILSFIANEISRDTYLNVMGQYRPCHNAHNYRELSRRPSADEMEEVLRWAREAGLGRLD